MRNWRRLLVGMLVALAVAIPLAAISLYVLNPFGANSNDPRQRILGFGPYRIASGSMLPTLAKDQVVLVQVGDYVKHRPQRGDIVVFRNPSDGNAWIARVIGLPEETIAIEDGVVQIDGRRWDEPYLDRERVLEDYSRWMRPYRVPQDGYFLLGDNRDNSDDGRLRGAVPAKNLMGRVVAVPRRTPPAPAKGARAR